MIKKIVVGVLLASLIGVLVAGAAIRTVDKTGQVAEALGSESGQGWGNAGGDQGVQDCDAEKGGGAQGQGNRGGAGGGAGNGGGGQGQGSQGGASVPGDGTGTGQAQVDEWVTLEGTVVSVDEDALVVQLDGGGELAVENRPWWFAQEQGFSAQVGDRVVADGFYENDLFEASRLSNMTSEQVVGIREESGRPLWAGQGRRGG